MHITSEKNMLNLRNPKIMNDLSWIQVTVQFQESPQIKGVKDQYVRI